MVLLDEPTSSIDPRTERHVYENLFRSFEGKTTISSLHRLYLLHYFDYVYILKDGHIVDRGTFEELKKRSLVFKELWDHQVSEIAAREGITTEVSESKMVLQEAKRA
jgi:ABC-type bacteriocin/lantibiotic exporter with double-glycine peptidase domain